MKKTAQASWHGGIITGQGTLSTQSRVLDQVPYSFNTRFTDEIGTNPEELLAAAHAGCFTMAVCHALIQQKFSPGDLNTRAVVTLDMSTGVISKINLELSGTAIQDLSTPKFQEIALAAKNNCLISKALSGVQIDLKVNYQEE